MQEEEPTHPLPFRFLICMGGNLPFSGSDKGGVDVTDWIAFHRIPVSDLKELDNFSQWAQANQDKMPHPTDRVGISTMFHPIMDEYVLKEYDREAFFTKLIHPDVDKERLDLPTCHVYGKNDEVVDGAAKMVELCSPKRRLQYIHEGGHDVPRSKIEVTKIAHLIEKTVQASM